MLEQPPERNILEIQAEALANAQSQILPTSGCMRALVWMAPFGVTCVALVAMAALSEFSKFRYRVETSSVVMITMLIVLIASFGIGLFDALLSSSVREQTGDSRNTKIVMHAVQFMLSQVLIVPGIALVLAAIIPVIFAVFANTTIY